MSREMWSTSDKDRIAGQVLELVRGLTEQVTEGRLQADREPDRVRAMCPPECRYDYRSD